MARLIGPDEGSREVRSIVNNTFRSKAERPAQLWTDAAATVPANVLTIAGSVIADSTVTIDEYSMLPLFQFPDGVDVVYATIDDGPAWPLYARADDRLDTLITRVTATEIVANAAETPAGAQAKATAAQATAISTAATDATTKASVAQAAAIATSSCPPMVSGEWRTNPGPSITAIALTLNTEHAVLVFVPAGTVLQAIAVWVSITGASSTVRLGIRADNGHQAGTLLLDAGTVAGTAVGSPASIPINFTVPAGPSTGVPLWLTATAQGTGAPTCLACTPTAEYRDSTTAAIAMGFRAAQRSAATITGALPASFTSNNNVSASTVSLAVQAA